MTTAGGQGPHGGPGGSLDQLRHRVLRRDRVVAGPWSPRLPGLALNAPVAEMTSRTASKIRFRAELGASRRLQYVNVVA